ncbi:hypothetical protein BKA61DRAFT_27696 [Leptodontidium sp. MPI-SDFR-AT-0119]|nr:hypothetical protein BKA61DRAFT_27696 [Leptodontidium sp. MPI-SDFR-AT-0119]
MGNQDLDRPYSNSPVSPLQTPTDGQRNMAVFSPVEQIIYSDEKIVMVAPVGQGMEVVEPNRRPSHAPEVVLAAPPMAQLPPMPPMPPMLPLVAPPGYADTELPSRPKPRPFWKRHILWIIAILGLGILVIGVVVGVIGHTESKSARTNTASIPTVRVTTNNTLNSVASSGLFLNDGMTWNTHVLWQNSTGGINLQISLDGQTFQPEQPVKLNIQPKIGSPLSATTEVDSSTGVVMLNLFYLSGVNNITMSAITCSPNSVKCNTIANCYLPTQIAPSNFTGLAAVNVNNAQDWRVYYHDENGYISELQGDNSGFNLGEPIGGAGLNASSIAAVNVNSTTNNINVFYVDGLTKALFKMQWTADTWTKPSIVSPDLIDNWNPRSGLGAAYTVSQDQLHVYYTGLDAGIYEFLGSGASKTINTSWAPQPGRNHLWATADFVGAPISAVGWDDQARFYQVKRGNLAEGALKNTTWTEAFIENNGQTG